MNTQGKIIRRDSEDFPRYQGFTGNINSVISRYEELRDKGYEEVNLYWNHIGDDVYISATQHREETDAEYEYRIGLEERAKERRREAYLKLKEEFGEE